MGYDKTKHGLLFDIQVQNANYQQDFTGSTIAGTSTTTPNIMSGHRFWDHATYVLDALTVAGGATGGSYSVRVLGTINGIANVPIAGITGLGPENMDSSLALYSLHGGASSPTPTGLSIVQEAAGGAIGFSLFCHAKATRGAFGDQQRVVEEELCGFTYTADETITLNAATGSTQGRFGGLQRMDIWEDVIYAVSWGSAAGNSSSGTWAVDIIGELNGTTVSIASTGNPTGVSTGSVGHMDADSEDSVRVLNSRPGSGSIRPTGVIVTEVTAGTGRFGVHVIAKGHRGKYGRP